MIWKQLRIPLLIITCVNVLFVVGRSIVDPTIGKRTLTPFVFPQEVPLPQWRLVESRPLKGKTLESSSFGKLTLPARQYRYIQNDLHLDIEMRYEVEADGDVRGYIKDQTPIKFFLDKPSVLIRQNEQLGFYGLLIYEERAYLDACINSRGGSTFTSEQFSNNRAQYDRQFNRLLAWVFVQQPLNDRRCLWAHLSIPLNQSSPDSAYVILEKAWFSWYQWWRPRFPKL